MGNYFNKEMKISQFDKKSSITFAHKNTNIKPENFKLHLNDCVEFYIFVSGNAEYIIENNCLPLSKGDVLAISPYEVHTPIFKTDCEYERFYLLFPVNTFSHHNFNALECFVNKEKDMSAKIQLCNKNKKEILKILYKLSSLSESQSKKSTQLKAAGLILEFLGYINDFDEITETSETSSGVPFLVRDILKYINLNPQNITSVNDIAKNFYISLPYLSSLFKKHMGVNINSYVRIKKIALAKKMLEDGESVTNSCYKCGFSDCSYFIKTFKEYVGVTPFQYKKRNK